jgi:hypothetical protein
MVLGKIVSVLQCVRHRNFDARRQIPSKTYLLPFHTHDTRIQQGLHFHTDIILRDTMKRIQIYIDTILYPILLEDIYSLPLCLCSTGKKVRGSIPVSDKVRPTGLKAELLEKQVVPLWICFAFVN